MKNSMEETAKVMIKIVIQIILKARSDCFLQETASESKVTKCIG